MGVPQLLPQLKDIDESVSLEQHRGQTLAVDAYSWLHKSVMSCPVELGQGLYTDRYVNYFRKRVHMLRHHGTEPFFVFDGDKFASKTGVENERERIREQNRELALNCVQKGDQKTAWKHFLLCVDVTPQMAKSVMEMLKLEKVRFVVAPYEADSQMVYLEKIGLVQGILSEDSDLLVFGAQCLLTKLNDTGICTRIRRGDFSKCKIAPLGLLSDAQFRMVACLAGCDYTSGIPGVGIVKAFRLVKRMGTMKKCIMSLKLEGKISVPVGFEQEYEKADISFQYQRVFNPVTNEMATLNDIPDSLLDHEHLLECIGPLHDIEIHRGIARGDLDPLTKETLLTREASLSQLKQLVSRDPPLQARTARRSYTSPPVAKLKVKSHSIDTFFRLSQPTPKTSSDDRPSVVAKRRKLFQRTSTLPTANSKFFPAKSTAVENEPVETSNTLGVQPTSAPAKTFLQTLPSSDFDLTDPDDNDDDDGHAHEHECKHNSEETEQKHVIEKENSIIENNGKAMDMSSPIIEDSSLIRPTNLIGAIVVSPTPSKQPTSSLQVREGLFAKYGFQTTASQSTTTTASAQRTPLISRPQNRQHVVSVKTKKGMTRNMSLDSFIYRG